MVRKGENRPVALSYVYDTDVGYDRTGSATQSKAKVPQRGSSFRGMALRSSRLWCLTVFSDEDDYYA